MGLSGGFVCDGLNHRDCRLNAVDGDGCSYGGGCRARSEWCFNGGACWLGLNCRTFYRISADSSSVSTFYFSDLKSFWGYCRKFFLVRRGLICWIYTHIECSAKTVSQKSKNTNKNKSSAQKSNNINYFLCYANSVLPFLYFEKLCLALIFRIIFSSYPFRYSRS